MKSQKRSTLQKIAPASVISKNKHAIEDFRYYRKIMDALEKIQYPNGKYASYKQMGASTSNVEIKINERISTT
jgi:hypothetical protein